jgi:hypothetical protein
MLTYWEACKIIYFKIVSNYIKLLFEKYLKETRISC